MNIEDLMYRKLFKVDATATVFDMSLQMTKEDIGSLLVERDGQIVGIVTDKDDTRKVIAKGLDPKTVTVGEIMTTPIQSIIATADIFNALDMMREYDIKRLGVIGEGGEICGIISAKIIGYRMRDIVSAMDKTS